MQLRVKLFIIALFCYFVLYGAQSILTYLQSDLGVSKSDAGLIITFTILPLAIVPLIGSFVIRGKSLTRTLKMNLIIMGTASLLIPLSDFEVLLGLRLVQGCSLAMALVAITSIYGKEKLPMSDYVASTIVGGLAGRFTSEFFAMTIGWNYFFYLLGLLMIASSLLAIGSFDQVKKEDAQHKHGLFKGLDIKILMAYALCFSFFFIFMSTMNTLPFIIKNRFPDHKSMSSLFYLGYLFGLFLTLRSQMILKLMGSTHKALWTGLLILIGSAILCMSSQVSVFFIAIFFLCGSMFFLHSVLFSDVARLVTTHAGASGIYLFFYYGGGVTGSYLSLNIYEQYGETGYNILMIFISILSVVFLTTYLGLRSYPSLEKNQIKVS